MTRLLPIALAISMPLAIGAALVAESVKPYVAPPEPEVLPHEPGPQPEWRSCAQHKGDDDGLTCLACNIYFEARSESFAGQVSVAKVTIARMKDPRYPKTLCGVVWQKIPGTQVGEFTWTTTVQDKYMHDAHAADVAYAAAKLAITASATGTIITNTVSDTALRYHATSVAPSWPGYKQVAKIGSHIFYAER